MIKKRLGIAAAVLAALASLSAFAPTAPTRVTGHSASADHARNLLPPFPFRLSNFAVKATMVPWYGGTANGTVVRVWPAKYTGDEWRADVVPGADADVVQIINIKSGRCLTAQHGPNAQLVLQDCQDNNWLQNWLPAFQGPTVSIFSRAFPNRAITLKTPGWNGSNLMLGGTPDSPAYLWQVQLN